MGPIGIGGVILILIVVLLLFGPSKLPELGRAFGKTLREFKKGASGIMDDDDSLLPRDRKEVQGHEVNQSKEKPSVGRQQDQRLPE